MKSQEKEIKTLKDHIQHKKRSEKADPEQARESKMNKSYNDG